MDGFGSIARARREALKIRLRQVARAIGRSTSYVGNVENGHTPGSASDRAAIEAYLREQEALLIPAAAPRKRDRATTG
jgi:transcriptional regulator with XRE-family HTH domain